MAENGNGTKWQIAFWVVTAIICVGIPTTTMAIHSETSERVKADAEINSGRSRGRLEIEQGVLDLRKETDDKFSTILQRLSTIEALIKFHMKDEK